MYRNRPDPRPKTWTGHPWARYLVELLVGIVVTLIPGGLLAAIVYFSGKHTVDLFGFGHNFVSYALAGASSVILVLAISLLLLLTTEAVRDVGCRVIARIRQHLEGNDAD